MPKYADMCERILANSAMLPPPASDCWVWLGSVRRASYYKYPSINIYSRELRKTVSRYAHRIAFEAFTGRTIPPGHEIDHRCYNTLCVNPMHLQMTTREGNLANRRRYKK